MKKNTFLVSASILPKKDSKDEIKDVTAILRSKSTSPKYKALKKLMKNHKVVSTDITDLKIEKIDIL